MRALKTLPVNAALNEWWNMHLIDAERSRMMRRMVKVRRQ
jgi:hypothetical protein